MGSKVRLVDAVPEIEFENGLLYISLNGKRCFACPLHIARVTNERIKRALDKMDAKNVEKIVAFK